MDQEKIHSNSWPTEVVSMRRLVNCRGNDRRGNDAGGSRSENIVAIDRPPFIPAWWRAQVILPVINWMCPVPVFRFHVVTLPPFIMTNVGVMMLVGMFLSK